MSQVPKISIVMPLYNKAYSLSETLDSIFRQSITDWELVVVDDGSTDDGACIIEGLKDSRIRILSQSNSGVSSARNRGVESANADLIAFLDADDIWMPEFLESMLSLVTDFPQATWYASSYNILHQNSRPFKSRLRGVGQDFKRGLLADYFSVAMVSDPPVWTSAVVVRKSSLLAVGGFPIGISSGEDLLTWARLAVVNVLAYDNRSLAVFKMSGIARRPDRANKVGAELVELARAHPSIPGLSQYIGLWFRMQAVMAIGFRESLLSRSLAFKSFVYAPTQWRSVYLILLVCMPLPLSQIIDRNLRLFVRSILSFLRKT